MSPLPRLKVEVSINVLPGDTLKDAVDRFAKAMAYNAASLDPVVVCYALDPKGAPIPTGDLGFGEVVTDFKAVELKVADDLGFGEPPADLGFS